jgi:cell wall-associated NlpC family hydrolase
MTPPRILLVTILGFGLLPSAWPRAGDTAPTRPATPTAQDRLIIAAERYLGKEWVFGGRDGRPGCLEDGRKARCPEGIDCLALIFFAYQEVLGTPWQRFSTLPSALVKNGQLGRPVPGLAGVLREELEPARLAKADVLLFMLKDANLDADKPLLTRGSDRYGVWHTGMVHSSGAEGVKVIHAKPGDRVVIENLEEVGFDALVALRLDSSNADSEPP